MPWIATITRVTKQEGKAAVAVQFTDGDDTFERSYILDGFGGGLDTLKRQIQQQIDGATAAYTIADTLELGKPFDPSPVVIPPDPDAVARFEFFTRYSKLQQLRSAVEQKVILADNADLLVLEAEVKATYRAEYFV